MTLSEKRLICESYLRIANEDDSTSIIEQNQQFDLNTLNSITNFKNRVSYCRKFLKHLGTGSSRIVFLMPNGHALKLAYNRKGVAQNAAEGGDYYKDTFDCFTKTFNYGNDGLWVETEIAAKCKKSDFNTLLGVSFEEMCDMLVLIVRERGRGREFPYHRFCKPESEIEEKLDTFLNDEDNFFYQINDYIGNYGVGESIADAFRLANWGIVTRDGEKWLVIIDSGLTDEIYDQYYSRRQNPKFGV